MMPNGERMAIEFLLEEPSFQPHHMPYIKNLGRSASTRPCGWSMRPRCSAGATNSTTT